MQQALGVGEQVLVGGGQALALGEAAGVVLVQLADHLDDLRVVALMQDFGEALLAKAAVVEPQTGVLRALADHGKDVLAGEQLAQHGVSALDGQVDRRGAVFHRRAQHIVLALLRAKAHPADVLHGADALGRVHDRIADLIHKLGLLCRTANERGEKAARRPRVFRDSKKSAGAKELWPRAAGTISSDSLRRGSGCTA